MNDRAMRRVRSSDLHPERHDARQGAASGPGPHTQNSPREGKNLASHRKGKAGLTPGLSQPPTPPPPCLMLKTALRHKQEVDGVGMGCPQALEQAAQVWIWP